MRFCENHRAICELQELTSKERIEAHRNEIQNESSVDLCRWISLRRNSHRDTPPAAVHLTENVRIITQKAKCARYDLSEHLALKCGIVTSINIFMMMMMMIIINCRWANLFNSRFLRSFAAQVNIWFTVAIGILLLFFVDSVRDVLKYSAIRSHEVEHHHHTHMDVEIQHQMKMFRAQRNFYIAGFSLFLAL